MSKIVKTKSGSYHTRIYIGEENGKPLYRSITADTKADAEKQCAEIRENKKKKVRDLTVKEAIERYIEISGPVLSPCSIETYEKICNYAFRSIINKRVDSLSDEQMQRAINEECRRKVVGRNRTIAPKTVHNEYGLVSSALKRICNKSFNVRLPKYKVKKEVLPDPQIVMQWLVGTSVELPCLLAMWCSLRMSEVLGLDCSHVNGDYLEIDQTRVTVHNALVARPLAKTDKSLRRVHLPKYIKELINNTDTYKNYLETGENQPLIPMTRDTLYHRYTTILEKHGIDISFHTLRHEFASISMDILKQSLQTTMDEGGWETPEVLLKYYSHSFESQRQEAATLRSEFLDSITNPQESKVTFLNGPKKEENENMKINMKKDG